MTKPKNRNPPQEKELWTNKIIGEKLDLTRDQVRNLLNRIPVAGKIGNANAYDPEKVLESAAKIAENKDGITGDREELEKEKLRQQIRKLTVEADTVEGKVIPTEDVFASFLGMALQFRKVLNEQAEKLPPLLAGLSPASMQIKIRDYNEDIITKLREHQWHPTESGS